MTTRLADAVHVLALLAEQPGVPLPSEHLAASLGAHPTHVRRLLGALAAAGITAVQRGAGGGALLARRADRVSLLDVQRAVDAAPAGPFAAAVRPPVAAVPDLVARHLGAALGPALDAAARAAERELARVTVADVRREVGRHAARAGAAAGVRGRGDPGPR